MDHKGGQVLEKLVAYSTRTKAASFKADPELWSRFKEGCKLRGVSICHVLEALMEAWLEGQKATATVIKPVTVNLTMHHIVKRPRRAAEIWEPWKKLWPPNCEHADQYWRIKAFPEKSEVGCAEKRDVVSIRECWECYKQRHSYGLHDLEKGT